MDKIRIALFDDHPLMREGIGHILAAESDMEIIGSGASGGDALRMTKELLPDVVILDVSMPGGGIEAAAAISAACPVVRIVMLTVSEDEAHVSAALQAGAHGYVLKGVSAPDLVRTVRAVANGEDYVSPSLAARLLVDMRKSKSRQPEEEDLLAELSAREEQILNLVAQGMSNKEVGLALDLREKTIKHYMTNILQKLRVRNRVEAALMAQKATPPGRG